MTFYCTVCKGRKYPGSAELGLVTTHNVCFHGEITKISVLFSFEITALSAVMNIGTKI